LFDEGRCKANKPSDKDFFPPTRKIKMTHKTGWGGARRGAGRPRLTPKRLDNPELQTTDPLQWLQTLMNTPEAGTQLRLFAAKALMLYQTR